MHCSRGGNVCNSGSHSMYGRPNVNPVKGIGRIPRNVGGSRLVDGSVRLVLSRTLGIVSQHFHRDNDGLACVTFTFDGYNTLEQFLTAENSGFVKSFRQYRVRGIGSQLCMPDPPSEGGTWTLVTAPATDVARWPAATSLDQIDQISAIGTRAKRIGYCRSGGTTSLYSAWPIVLVAANSSGSSSGGTQARGVWIGTDDGGRNTKHWGNKWLLYKCNHYGKEAGSGTVIIGDRYPSAKMLLQATLEIDLKDPVVV